MIRVQEEPPFVFVVAAATLPIPALSPGAMAALGLTLALLGLFAARRV